MKRSWPDWRKYRYIRKQIKKGGPYKRDHLIELKYLRRKMRKRNRGTTR